MAHKGQRPRQLRGEQQLKKLALSDHEQEEHKGGDGANAEEATKVAGSGQKRGRSPPGSDVDSDEDSSSSSSSDSNNSDVPEETAGRMLFVHHRGLARPLKWTTSSMCLAGALYKTTERVDLADLATPAFTAQGFLGEAKVRND